jgi:hypothetical protein
MEMTMLSTTTEYLPEVWEDQMITEQERLVEMLEELGLAYDSLDIVNEFGLGFIEEHGVNIGTMVDFINDPTNQDSWVFGF